MGKRPEIVSNNIEVLMVKGILGFGDEIKGKKLRFGD